jgi:hypothetical protein
MQFGQLKRRQFITLIAGGAGVLLLPPAWAQEAGRTYHIGVMTRNLID